MDEKKQSKTGKSLCQPCHDEMHLQNERQVSESNITVAQNLFDYDSHYTSLIILILFKVPV